jgi:hypothetical protein
MTPNSFYQYFTNEFDWISIIIGFILGIVTSYYGNFLWSKKVDKDKKKGDYYFRSKNGNSTTIETSYSDETITKVQKAFSSAASSNTTSKQ